MNKIGFHLPKGSLGRTVLSLVITALIGFVYFYVSLPAINPHSSDFYSFLGLLCVVYVICVFLLSGAPRDNVVRAPAEKLKEWFRFVKSRCLPVGILFVAVVLVALVGQVLSMPIFRAGSYRDLLTVEEGNFASDVAQISFNEIPTLDRTSAEYLGDRQMGTLSDMVSQFEYSNDSTQINYQGRPVRVAPIAYADLFKWLTNRGNGLPAYVVVDMVTQEATVVRLSEGMKYSFSEPLNRNIVRHLRFQYPTMMFSTPEFEIDENGHPWWIAPRVVKTIGLFGGTDIQGAVLVDAVTGESQYYEEVPTWVDTLYVPELIMQQYDYHGTLVHGFINSILGQKDVTVTTDGYNYIAMNDDVYAYTGVTSANADQSNLGFLLCNMRTKQTTFYEAPGATEAAARASAEGVVQDLGYKSTFPLLLNIAGEPTYFIPLLDATNLVKMYAMVNVAQYQIVATGTTVSSCEQTYIQLLANKGITQPEELPQTQASGTVAEIRTAVLDGNSYYFLRLEGDEVFYSLSASQNRDVVTLNVGDTVTIDHAIPAEGEQPSILDGYTLTIDGRTSSNHMGFTVDGNSAPTIDSESQDIPSALDPAPQT
ncbi:CvpA family protein [Flavonifractor sp. An100]|uniref:CvpA family protein n=1 Tax=Flavonifractor sp. An100 TaxID=1965538 RepID=UPI001FA8B728|nr:CvpA family protein [Flavonifractor sp. An100]